MPDGPVHRTIVWVMVDGDDVVVLRSYRGADRVAGIARRSRSRGRAARRRTPPCRARASPGRRSRSPFAGVQRRTPSTSTRAPAPAVLTDAMLPTLRSCSARPSGSGRRADRDVPRRVQAPAARHRPSRRPTTGSPRSTRSSSRRARPGPGSCCTSCSSGPASSRSGCRRSPRPATSTRSARSRSRTSRATRAWSGASAGSSAGTRWRWSCARTTGSPGSAATSRRTRRRRPCTRSASTTSSAARTAAGRGDQIFYQGHAAPGIYARAFLEGRLSEDQLDHFRRETVPGQGLSLLPASAAHAGLLGVPDGLDGPRPDRRDLPGPLQPLPPEPRPARHVGLARVGVPRRRRDRRARVARRAPRRGARGPRQPDLRRQLQPAAPRRPGARQRQDHPGARGRLPRRRLERDQGHLGPRVGRAPGARRGRRPRREDERDGRRRVPEVLGRRRRVHPRALLRAGSAAPASSSST